ncbi:MAG: UbiX family flavin prenyltransferase [Burkholderia sp.]|nr:UbiX family flavin prenyltransferase [Burkholderia sp.]
MEHKNTSLQKLIIGITGATGVIYGVRLLDMARTISGIETHLLVSKAGWLSIAHELQLSKSDIEKRADVVYSVHNIGAAIASGSFVTAGMIITPCSMNTLASVAHGLSNNLITRAADVILKERRKLILMVRETPFNLAHLRNMVAVSEMGGIVFPPLPAFYMQPKTIDEMIDQTVSRVLDLFSLGAPMTSPWLGIQCGYSSQYSN